MAFETPLNDITEGDLQRLVDNDEPEDLKLEYKRDYPGNGDGERKEFLGDISAFANASGGRLIFGIEEGKGQKKGVPVKLVGVKLPFSVDEATRDLENRIREGIQPRIIVALRILPLTPGSHAIVIDIHRSMAAPHMVTIKDSTRFYVRVGGGKYPLNVNELRSAFLRSETIAERMRNFRAERIAKIISGDAPFPLEDGGKVMVHLVPFTAFDPGVSTRYNVIEIVGDSMQQQLLQTIGQLGINDLRPDFDGIHSFADAAITGKSGYVKVFRTGMIEAVDAHILRADRGIGAMRIPSATLETRLVEAMPWYIQLLRSLGVETPIAVMLTLVGVHGFYMTENFSNAGEENKIDRDILDVPESIVDDYDEVLADMAKFMKPIFDVVWNAAGYLGSLNYDANGRWQLSNEN